MPIASPTLNSLSMNGDAASYMSVAPPKFSGQATMSATS
jgi:hypothetical protein